MTMQMRREAPTRRQGAAGQWAMRGDGRDSMAGFFLQVLVKIMIIFAFCAIKVAKHATVTVTCHIVFELATTMLASLLCWLLLILTSSSWVKASYACFTPAYVLSGLAGTKV
jgi:hypothetical protein